MDENMSGPERAWRMLHPEIAARERYLAWRLVLRDVGKILIAVASVALIVIWAQTWL